MIAENHDAIIGKSIAHYKILSLLGQGGMGQVYLANDTRLGRKVALKLIPTQNNERLRRFEVEARSASALNHPNVCVIHEIGETGDGRHFIGMEHIEGMSLRQRLVAGALPVSESIDIALQVASALAAAHEAGVVHRDIKPENVMLRRDGYVKVVDFGLAKLTERFEVGCTSEVSTLPVSITRSGLMIGTVNYLSPERARGEKADERSDIWSLGVVLYEMLTGSMPFTGETPSHTVVAILESEPSPLTDHVTSAPAELDWIVRKALRKERVQRYQTAIEFAADLGQLRQEVFAGPSSRLLKSKITKPQPFSRMTILAAALVMVISLGLLFFWGRNQNTTTNAVNIDSLAVLPFMNMSTDPDMDYLSDGITDTLINSLARLPNVKVIGRSSVFRYKGRQATANDVGQELRVKAVLTGRIVQRGNEVSISVDLENATDSSHIWGEQYNRKVSDLLTIQDEISSIVTQKLRVEINEDDRRRLTQRYTDNVDAYQLYLKGRWFWNQRTGDGRRQALASFEKAIEIDPNYALAYAGLADVYVLSTSLTEESYLKAKQAANQALKQDPKLGEAHATLGFIKTHYERDWAGGEAEFKRAIELSPNYATGHHWYADHLQALGHFDLALQELKRAAELEPFSPIINTAIGAMFLYTRQYDKSIEHLRQTCQLFPDFFPAYLYLGAAYSHKKMYSEALSEYQQAKKLSKGHSLVLAMIGYNYAVWGKKSEARKILKELEARTSKENVPPLRFALVFTALGQIDRAFEWLNKACEEPDIHVIYVKVNPVFDTLRGDPRFAFLLQRLSLA